MRKKQFKAESKKLLDMMINSIYTHKEIFLRELISNASDATDKLYFKSLTDDSIKADKDSLKIRIDLDKENRTIKVSDNGIGMTAEELENNLGTIAKSDSLDFKNENADDDNAKDITAVKVYCPGNFLIKLTALDGVYLVETEDSFSEDDFSAIDTSSEYDYYPDYSTTEPVTPSDAVPGDSTNVPE